MLRAGEAAALVGKHPQTIRAWGKQGLIVSESWGARDTRFDRDSLLAYCPIEQEPAPQRPAGGLYDPEWGMFDQNPYPTLAEAHTVPA
jgi:hypothetical protein